MKDYLGLSLREVPYFRALLRSVEARFFEDLELPSPTIDIGCGDGHFAGLMTNNLLDVGIDPGWDALQEAAVRDVYQGLICASGASLPFPSRYFRSAMSNSVLEHISEVDLVLEEIARVLQPGAPFAFSVPNRQFLKELSLGQFFDRFGASRWGDRYRTFFNDISRIAHLDGPDLWVTRLRESGFIVEEWWNYFSPEAHRALEWGHYLGLPSYLSKKLTGKWILAPTRWNLHFTRKLVERYFEEDSKSEDGTYTFYVARRL